MPYQVSVCIGTTDVNPFPLYLCLPLDHNPLNNIILARNNLSLRLSLRRLAMSTPAHLAAELEALLAYETASNDEFYECNSDQEAAEGAAAQEDAPEALDDAQPSEEAAEAQEQGPVIPFALPPSDTRFHSIEEAWGFLDRWTGPRGHGPRIHRTARPDITGNLDRRSF